MKKEWVGWESIIITVTFRAPDFPHSLLKKFQDVFEN